MNVVLDLQEICDILNDINLFNVNSDIILDAVKEIYNSSKITIVEEKKLNNNKSSLDEMNSLRLLKTPIHISLTQIKENLKSDFFQMILEVFFDSAQGGDGELAISTLKQILPKIISCMHFVTKEERCIYIAAIEFYLRDSQRFHNPQDFHPKLLENYCDNLIISCAYRKNKKCSISNEQVYRALNSLESKYILERDMDTNGYKYIRW